MISILNKSDKKYFYVTQEKKKNLKKSLEKIPTNIDIKKYLISAYVKSDESLFSIGENMYGKSIDISWKE